MSSGVRQMAGRGVGARTTLARSMGRPWSALALPALGIACLAITLIAAGSGAFAMSPAQVIDILAHRAGLAGRGTFTEEQEAVLLAIRLPRVGLALLTGAALGMAGAVLQGLFRNPLAEPALVGVAGGAALAAAWTIVLGATWIPGLARVAGPFTLPVAAFAGSLVAATLVFQLARSERRVSMPVMLLAGVAVNALAWSGIGLATFVANDEQLRSITFWQLGSLGGASPSVLGVLVTLVGLAGYGMMRLARVLDACALGDAQARHLGIDVRSVNRAGICWTALAVGATTGVTGIVGFVGLVAPHLVRLAAGPSHRLVVPGSALVGAGLVVAADTVARTVVVPAELPIGVVTGLVGSPFFVVLLLRMRRGELN